MKKRLCSFSRPHCGAEKKLEVEKKTCRGRKQDGPIARSRKRHFGVEKKSSPFAQSPARTPSKYRALPCSSRYIRVHLAPHIRVEHFVSISEGQPFCLHVLQSLARAIHNKDRDLPDILAQGVSTGAFDSLPSSGLWAQAQQGLEFGDNLSGPALEHCTGNWTSDLLSELIDKEIAQGWVRKYSDAKQNCQPHQTTCCANCAFFQLMGALIAPSSATVSAAPTSTSCMRRSRSLT